MKEVVSITQFISNKELQCDPSLRYVLADKMRNALAKSIVEKCWKETTSDYTTSFRLEVIVLTPEEFQREVEKKALEFNARFSKGMM